MRAGVLAFGFAVLALGIAGCGPIVYINDVTRGASTKVDEAREANADKYAPYWWTRATEYLRKSRELAAHADFQAANRYGRLAGEAAEKAIEEALVASKDPAKRNAPAKEPNNQDKGPIAPAKETP